MTTCHCAAYPFPHRLGGGRCSAAPGQLLCAACRMPAKLIDIEDDDGAYDSEFWGGRMCWRPMLRVTACCEARPAPNQEATPPVRGSAAQPVGPRMG